MPVTTPAADLAAEIERSADAGAARIAVDRLCDVWPEAGERLAADPVLRLALVTVAAASPYLGRVCVTEPAALDVLAAAVGDPAPPAVCPAGPAVCPAGAVAPCGSDGPSAPTAAHALARRKHLGILHIAARDLLGLDPLEAVGAQLADLADSVLAAALDQTGTGGLAVVGMGKLGARELNYSSDIDLVLVAQGDPGPVDPRPMLDVVRRSWRVDLGLRPEGRSGRLVRSMDSYRAYWDRWAETWEFQALLKARACAGDPGLGGRFCDEAAARVWGRPFGSEELRQVRAMKARTEGSVARAGLADRELKAGTGGIRDVEFAVQLLQLVHGRSDPGLRVPSTLGAVGALVAGGYVAQADGDALSEAYRFLRAVEHRLQLREDQQVHTLPAGAEARRGLARVLGFRDGPATTALARFHDDLGHHRATVRSIHERLFFRPLLEAFTAGAPGAAPAPAGPGAPAVLAPHAAADRLAAFGFSDADRTRRAVVELTRGLSRSSALMAQLLPLLLDWLSESPDPDLGLLGLRSLTDDSHRRDRLSAMCRESPEAARRLCALLGTGPRFVRDLQRHPDSLAGLADGTTLASATRTDLDGRVGRVLSWRSGPGPRAHGLRHWQSGQLLRVAARDVLGLDGLEATGTALADLAEATLAAAVTEVDPQVPLAVIGMGRLGGSQLAYASDLDVLLVFGGENEDPLPAGAAAEAARAAEGAATSLLRLVNGETPAARLYTLDIGLRPEGRQGPLARSLDAYATYYRRWAQAWERQALLRGRFVAGDAGVGRRFAALAAGFVWGRPFSPADAREVRRMKARMERERIPAGEDPQFHLKLGPGSLSDVEWTAQLLQLLHQVALPGTVDALGALAKVGALAPADAAALVEAYRFCEATRNRLFLVRGGPADALPSTGPHLTALARSLGTSPALLREKYRRLTRRARRVVERVFYHQPVPAY